jgi:hypothetical protein
MPRTETLTDVPESEVDQLVQDFKDSGATKVEKTKQANGKYTVVATFPDEPDGGTSGTTPAQKKNGEAKSTSSSIGKTPAASTSSSASGAHTSAIATSSAKTLQRDGIPWSAEIDGDDIVVRKVLVTAFGGGFDTGDSGETESGVMNDGSNPNLMGCALPMKTNESATKGSPLAFAPPIPWHTKVRFWRGDDEASGIETELIDNGPNVLKYPDHAGDLTVVAALKFAPQIPLQKMANEFETTLSYRIIGGKKFVV